jgi:hypothetical protein
MKKNGKIWNRNLESKNPKLEKNWGGIEIKSKSVEVGHLISSEGY